MSTKESIQNDLEWVLKQSAGTLEWNLWEYELLDLLHECAIYGDSVRDDNDHKLSYAQLVSRILPIFGYKPNRNPYNTITWLMSRSDYVPMRKRYERKIGEGKSRPILDFISTK